MNIYSKFLSNRSAYCIRKCYNNRASGSSAIHQYHALLISTAAGPQSFTFPATLINQSNRQESLSGRHLFVKKAYVDILLATLSNIDAGHNRYHKEHPALPITRGSAISPHGWHNHPRTVLQCHRRILLQFPADSTVIQRIIFLLT